ESWVVGGEQRAGKMPLANKILYLMGAAACFAMAGLFKSFWLGGFGAHPGYGARRIPGWLGRLLFVLGGLWLIYDGFLR
ncbi:MAG TPA: hypothetical protein VMS96_09025, partial [Terriglobales bacterium]|nr:hypothetical protein [Terriglobales bacterium]